ncbi:MAG: hypothetical protein FD175_2057 [Beijerinckiaceae bacterium]|nr:MAG: hypothetical protein FD175_2057 [Beijerinckiaceae bacterium]
MKILTGTALAFAVLLSANAFASAESDHLGSPVMKAPAAAGPLANFTAISPETIQKVAVTKSTDPARNVNSGK